MSVIPASIKLVLSVDDVDTFSLTDIFKLQVMGSERQPRKE